jgi:hypothetical protein
LAHDPQQIAEITIIMSAVPELSGVNMIPFRIGHRRQCRASSEHLSCESLYENRKTGTSAAEAALILLRLRRS